MNGDKLTWLLRALGISGKTLADAIGVDHSTMSKWRRGGRTLRYNSPYAQAIAHFAIESSAERRSGAVRRMLCETYPGLNGEDTEQLENALHTWLTVPDSPEDEAQSKLFAVPLATGIGVKNMFEAQQRLFSLLSELPAGQEIIVTDFGAVDWAHAGAEQLEQGVQCNLTALNGGRNTMQIIDLVADTYRPWELMFQWLPIYLQQGVSTWSYAKAAQLPLRQNFILIRGYAALVMSSTPAAPELVISSLYRAPEYVRLFDMVVDSIRFDSRPMMQVMETHQLTAYLHLLESRMKSGSLLYMINRLPTFRNMPEEVVEEILRNNSVAGEMRLICLAAWRQAAETRGRCESRLIYDFDSLRTALAQDYIVDADLSAAVGHEIRISRAQLCRQLEWLRLQLEEGRYTAAIPAFSQLDIEVLPPCNLIVQFDSLAAAWDAKKYGLRLYSEESSIVDGFYQYADTLWSHLPPSERHSAVCEQKIDALLAKYR